MTKYKARRLLLAATGPAPQPEQYVDAMVYAGPPDVTDYMHTTERLGRSPLCGRAGAQVTASPVGWLPRCPACRDILSDIESRMPAKGDADALDATLQDV